MNAKPTPAPAPAPTPVVPVLATLAQQFQTQSLNSVVAGFSFAAAVAWLDFVRFLVGAIVKVPKNSSNYFLLTAVFTTILSLLVYLVISRISKDVQKPKEPVFALTR